MGLEKYEHRVRLEGLQVTAMKSGINRWPGIQEDSESMKAATDTKQVSDSHGRVLSFFFFSR